jgi:hypothetical protein
MGRLDGVLALALVTAVTTRLALVSFRYPDLPMLTASGR